MELEVRDVSMRLNRPLPIGAVHPEPAQKEEPALFKLLSANVSLVIWLVFLAFGGTLLTCYYAHIHYLPDLEWKESLTYLAALSFIGGGIALLYGLLLYLPGVIWSEFLIFDTELQNVLCYEGIYRKEPCFLSIGKRLLLPFMFFMVASHLPMLKSHNAKGVLAVSLTALVPASLYVWAMFREDLARKIRKKRRTTADRRSLLLKYVGLFDVSALVSLAAVLVLYSIASRGNAVGRWPMLVICTVLVVVSNLLVAVQFRNKPRRAVLTGIISALMLLVCGEAFYGKDAAISTQIMESLGLRGEANKTLLLTEEGKRIFPSYAVGGIGDARILSRLGAEYFVEVGQDRFAVPRALVAAWKSGPDKATAPVTQNPDVGLEIAVGLAIALLGFLSGWILRTAKLQTRQKRERRVAVVAARRRRLRGQIPAT
jgi:hypothetical protein